MTIPTQEEFQHLYALLKNDVRPALVIEAARIVAAFVKAGAIEMATLTAFVRAEQAAYAEEWNVAAATPAMRWLDGQAAFQRALQSAHKKAKPPASAEEVARSIANAVSPATWEVYLEKHRKDGRLGQKTDEDLRLRYERRASQSGQAEVLASQLRTRPLWRTGAGIVRALRDYHYSSRKYIENSRRLPILLKKAEDLYRDAVQAGAELEACAESLNIHARAGHRFISTKQWTFDRLKAGIRDAPIKRFDKTARERLLIMALADNFQSAYQSYKPAAIADLLTLEGIENQLDLRTIERTLKEHRERRMRRSTS